MLYKLLSRQAAVAYELPVTMHRSPAFMVFMLLCEPQRYKPLLKARCPLMLDELTQSLLD